MSDHADGFTTVGTYTPDNLYDRFEVRRKCLIAAEQGAVPRGALLGKVTATGKWALSTAAAVDGTETPRGVLLHDVDATAEDAEGIIGRRGRCNSGALTLGAGHTLASIDDDLLERGIILERVIG